jgi:hypothetical protein
MWWFSRSKTKESGAETDEPPASKDTALHPATARILDLQQAVGHQTAREMIGKTTADASQSAGAPLEHDVRQTMEARFGADLSLVRVHADGAAAQSAEALEANAYTRGREIYFAAGTYAPRTPDGQRLLAHELTHVLQHQMSGSSATSGELSQPSDASEREADHVAEAVTQGRPAPAVVTASAGIHRDVGWARRGPLPDPYGTLLLLNAFAKKFTEAAKLIYNNPAAMKLVDEAEAAGVEFGGYAEDGPGKAAGRAYTIGKSVYVPKSQTDPMMAMRDFLFELNNALRQPKFAELMKEATKGSTGSLTAKQYAYKIVEQEVEGALRLGEIWFETKKTMPKGAATDAYDRYYFLSNYEEVRTGKKTKDEVVREVLMRVYETGTLKGKTVEQNYMEQYERISDGK